MATKVYGCSDDNVCFEGDIRDEIGCWDTDLLLLFSDGTVLKTHYGKHVPGQGDDGIWQIRLITQGSLFDHIEECFDSDADIYSDIAHFRDGLAGEVAGLDEVYEALALTHAVECQDPEVCKDGLEIGCNDAIMQAYHTLQKPITRY